MVDNILATGKMESNMERVNMCFQVELKNQEYGNTVSEFVGKMGQTPLAPLKINDQ